MQAYRAVAAATQLGRILSGYPAVALSQHAFCTHSKKDKLDMIKALRGESGAPIGDVKAALEEVGYDMDQAYQALRKKGMAAAAKKSSRAAAEVPLLMVSRCLVAWWSTCHAQLKCTQQAPNLCQ